MTPRVHRQIRLTGLANGAELRNGKLYGEDHLIVPVVALVGDAVVRPLNSKGAEFVPAEELRKSTHQWANRPVVPDHPDNGRASANDPATLEAMGFGSTFNPRFEDGRLKLEAWLNLKRAAALGGDAQKVVDRARAGEMIEVSVGAWVSVLEASGVSPTGKAYSYRWSDIDSDHLAMLPEGAEGACSVDMGCGAPRAARKDRSMTKKLRDKRARSAIEGVGSENLSAWLRDALQEVHSDAEYLWVETIYDDVVIYMVQPESGPNQLYQRAYTLDEEAESVTVGPDAIPVKRKVEYEEETMAAAARRHGNALLQRIMRAMGIRSAQEDEGMSDADLRGSLWDAIRAVEPGFDGIVEVFPDSGTVIYAAFPEQDLIFYRRSFTMADGGEVSLADDREEVEPVTRFEPVAAESQPTETKEPAAAENCGCPKEGRSIRAAHTSTAAEAEEESMTKKNLVGRLIDCERSPFTKESTEVLEAMSEEQLQALADSFQEPEEPEEEAEPKKAAPPTEPEPEKVAEPATPPEDVVQLRKEEYERMRAATACFEAQQKATKDALVAQLKGAQTTYTEARLQAKSVEELQELASLLKLDEPRRDYSGQGLPIAAASAGDDPDGFNAGPPDTYKLRAAEAKRKEAN